MCYLLLDNNAFFFKFVSVAAHFSEQLIQVFFSVLFCFYSFLQITREEAQVLFFQEKLHPLKLYHALSWKAWECDNDTVSIVSQRAQVRGKVSKQSGRRPGPAFYIIWSIKRASHRSVIYNTILKSLHM